MKPKTKRQLLQIIAKAKAVAAKHYSKAEAANAELLPRCSVGETITLGKGEQQRTFTLVDNFLKPVDGVMQPVNKAYKAAGIERLSWVEKKKLTYTRKPKTKPSAETDETDNTEEIPY